MNLNKDNNKKKIEIKLSKGVTFFIGAIFTGLAVHDFNTFHYGAGTTEIIIGIGMLCHACVTFMMGEDL